MADDDVSEAAAAAATAATATAAVAVASAPFDTFADDTEDSDYSDLLDDEEFADAEGAAPPPDPAVVPQLATGMEAEVPPLVSEGRPAPQPEREREPERESEAGPPSTVAALATAVTGDVLHGRGVRQVVEDASTFFLAESRRLAARERAFWADVYHAYEHPAEAWIAVRMGEEAEKRLENAARQTVN